MITIFIDGGEYVDKKTYIQTRNENTRLRETIERFKHTHVNSGDGTDTCKTCGLDLRNEVHLSRSE